MTLKKPQPNPIDELIAVPIPMKSEKKEEPTSTLPPAPLPQLRAVKEDEVVPESLITIKDKGRFSKTGPERKRCHTTLHPQTKEWLVIKSKETDIELGLLIDAGIHMLFKETANMDTASFQTKIYTLAQP